MRQRTAADGRGLEQRVLATLTALENFPRYRGALRAVCLADDPWATAPAVDLLCAGFTGTAAERVDIDPRALCIDRIGHFGSSGPTSGSVWPLGSS